MVDGAAARGCVEGRGFVTDAGVGAGVGVSSLTAGRWPIVDDAGVRCAPALESDRYPFWRPASMCYWCRCWSFQQWSRWRVPA